ncbi:MAG: UDP-N-acetylmuramoyl-L-alanine--D-glutamate ligase [Sedimentisphaerales bacterium]|jgi:UDP-N-acetylmuramoylalanine--D-glutamate ligase
MGEGLFRDKKILVMGLGRFGGGVDVVKFACSAGARVIVTDLAKQDALAESIAQLKGLDITYHLGSHEPADFEQADMVVANPAVPLDNKFLQIARKAGRKVTSQIELFFELCPAKIIGITGANGKSTTTALTAHLLRSRFNKKVWLGGNIGNEPMLTIVGKIKPDDMVVLELSSFQIEQLAQSDKAPQVALLTNLTPNHLDRYKTFENYCKAKELIFQHQKPNANQSAVSIFNGDDEVSSKWFAKYQKDAGRICVKFSADGMPARIRSAYGLPGRAYLVNLAGAIAIAKNFGVTDEQIIGCLPAFKALPHRLQLVGEARGVRWYNDSKATTPDSSIVALEAFDSPIIIAGGYDKHIPFDEFGAKIAQKAKAAILIGQTAQVIGKIIQNNPQNKAQVRYAKTLAEAVQMANTLAVKGDAVLLSPACASYDMFENYEQRGEQFIELVNKVIR